MKNKTSPLHTVVVDKLSIKERNERLRNLFTWLETAPKHKTYKEYPPQMAAYQTIFEQVQLTLDASISAKKRGDVVATHSSLNQSLDGLLALLKDKEHANTAPNSVYSQLLYVLSEKDLYIESYHIAQFLYYRRYSITVKVIMALMLQASKMHQYPKALDYFEQNRDRFQEIEYDVLYEQYLRIKIAQGRCQEVINECQEQLRNLYQISYNKSNKVFFKGTEEFTFQSNELSNRHIRSFFILLTNAYLKNNTANLDHATSIATLLQKTFPDNYEITILLAQCYTKQNHQNAVLNLYVDYLEKFPDNLGMCIHCMIYLIKNNMLKEANSVYDVFIHHYKNIHQNNELRSLKLLYAWFLASPEQGKLVFEELRQDFPDHPMVAYAAIWYAIKHRNFAWLEELKQTVQTQFVNSSHIIKYVRALSPINLISAAIESLLLSPEELLREAPENSGNSRKYVLPPGVEEAFQRFCTCEQKLCRSTCLENVFLTGSAVDEIIAWNLALKKGEFYDIDRKLKNKDLDFIAIVDKIPEKSSLPGFKTCPPRDNLFRYQEGDLSIDISYFRWSAESNNDANDILNILKDHGDIQHRRIIMDCHGLAVDYAKGKAFKAMDKKVLAVHGDPKVLFNEDPMRILRVAKTAIEKKIKIDSLEISEKMPQPDNMTGQQEETDTSDDLSDQEIQETPIKEEERSWSIAPSLTKSLHRFVPLIWLNNARLRKRFLQLITHPSHGEDFFQFMSIYHLLSPELEADSWENCMRKIVEYLREQGNLTVIDNLIKEQEKNCVTIENDIQAYQLEQDIQDLKTKLKHLREGSKNLQDDINKKENNYNKTINKNLTTWKKEQLPQKIKNESLSLLKKVSELEEKCAVAKRQYQDELQTKLSFSKQNSEHTNTIQILKRLIANLRYKDTNSYSHTTSSLFPMQKMFKYGDLDLKIHNWEDLNIEELANLISIAYDPSLAAFLYLNLGNKCFYHTNNSLEAWLYFKMAEMRLQIITNDPQILNFLQTVLSPLLNAAFHASNLALIEPDTLLETLSHMEEDAAVNKIIKIWAYIEHSLSCDHLSQEIKESLLKYGIMNHSKLILYDFFYYLSLCDLALDLNLLNETEIEYIKTTILQEIECNKISPYQESDSNSAWLTYIQQSQNVTRFPHIQRILQQEVLTINVIPLLKMGFFNNQEHFSNSMFDFLNNLCVCYIQIAESFAANHQYPTAVAYYEIMIREATKIKFQNLFSTLFHYWASQRIQMLQTRQQDLSIESSIVPLLDKMMAAWNTKEETKMDNVGSLYNSI